MLSLATVLKVCKRSATLLKRDFNTGVFFEYSKSFRDTIFHRATSVAAFELSFSIRKEF